MKHVVQACAVAIAVIGLVSNAQASANDDTWQTLQKAAVAARALNYKGIFVCQIGQQSKSVQITHLFNGKGEFARNVVLDGSPRELLSQGSELVIYNPKNEKIVIEKRRGQNMFPAILPANLDAIKASYTLRAGEVERVAGRNAQLLFLDPKDNLRYGYQFWIDQEYGLLLKSAQINHAGQVMESMAFNQLSLINDVDLDWFKPNIDNHKRYVMESESAPIADNSVSTDWTLAELPAGYHKIQQVIRMVHGKSVPVTQVVFSDGLASVSLFVEPANKMIKSGSPAKSTHGVVGNASFYANVVDGYQLTVVGEVPETTVEKIANAVVFKK
ncbi:sigma-E factor regulatory protein RseB precursor [mine drainage metagenome]|uniref:Sigma-E factor regulatory protein RseB n=1 Tax=mine drainage metagenome TaxID=410659 RepID=A0A1J5S3P8_9ZZZZ